MTAHLDPGFLAAAGIVVLDEPRCDGFTLRVAKRSEAAGDCLKGQAVNDSGGRIRSSVELFGNLTKLCPPLSAPLGLHLVPRHDDHPANQPVEAVETLMTA
jgi:hypothetical protein